MGARLFVGKPGAGKTIALVRETRKALAEGRDVYANFMLGRRSDGWMVPTCPEITTRNVPCLPTRYVSPWGFTHDDHAPTSAHFEPFAPHLVEVMEYHAMPRGRGFIPDPRMQLLTEWAQVNAIRVGRDALGRGHKMRLVKNEDGAWTATPACRMFDCPDPRGCSHGITIAIDELNLWAPSRLWQEMGIDVLNRWAYIRKDGLDVLATAQHESRVDVVARQVMSEIWTCRVLGPGIVTVAGRDLHVQLFTRQKWEPEVLTEKGRTNAAESARHVGLLAGLFDYKYNLFDREAAESYDTFEHVQAAVKREDKTAVTVEVREIIASHLRGNHAKRSARTCPVCQVEGESKDRATNVAPAA